MTVRRSPKVSSGYEIMLGAEDIFRPEQAVEILRLAQCELSTATSVSAGPTSQCRNHTSRIRREILCREDHYVPAQKHKERQFGNVVRLLRKLHLRLVLEQV